MVILTQSRNVPVANDQIFALPADRALEGKGKMASEDSAPSVLLRCMYCASALFGVFYNLLHNAT